MSEKGMKFTVRKGGRKIIEQTAGDRPPEPANEKERIKDEEPKKSVRDRTLGKK